MLKPLGYPRCKMQVSRQSNFPPSLNQSKEILRTKMYTTCGRMGLLSFPKATLSTCSCIAMFNMFTQFCRSSISANSCASFMSLRLPEELASFSSKQSSSLQLHIATCRIWRHRVSAHEGWSKRLSFGGPNFSITNVTKKCQKQPYRHFC